MLERHGLISRPVDSVYAAPYILSLLLAAHPEYLLGFRRLAGKERFRRPEPRAEPA
jgi:hypothetical protein